MELFRICRDPTQGKVPPITIELAISGGSYAPHSSVSQTLFGGEVQGSVLL